MTYTILVINPGSTSTKVGVYRNEETIFSATVAHPVSELQQFDTVADQLDFREGAILKVLEDHVIDLNALDCVVARGGLVRPLPHGIYRVNEKMKQDLRTACYGGHASNLGALIADKLATKLGIPAYISDPVVVDELDEVARLTGIKEIKRRSIFHALNQRAVALRYARSKGVRYEDLVLIIAHMGGGVTVGLHRRGRVVDVNNGLDGEGPFAPERAGTIPAGDLVTLCFSGKYTEHEIRKLLTGQGGFVNLAGTNDVRELERRASEGDAEAELLLRAFVYRVAKEIGALAAAAEGKVDAILLTGGIAHDEALMAALIQKVSWIAPVTVYPGEGELEALRDAGLRVLRGEEIPVEY
ncbi:MAG: butyrate kinase [Treponemataceae bacterium]|nr:butyrate kinase [Treponemataceae bacterium]HOK00195.1 butyrate kinase [Termitinemataceae bacterium]HOM24434.1 butyrate kinase [Termitinemataceae bacterium]HPQ01547.1 butyrate kinase [Termitinemataceae bacterium]